MITYYKDYDELYSRFGPVEKPTGEIDTERIIDIVFSEAGAAEESADYIIIGTSFIGFDTPNLTDPGGGTWAVQIKTGGKILYYTVDVSTGTAAFEKEREDE